MIKKIIYGIVSISIIVTSIVILKNNEEIKFQGTLNTKLFSMKENVEDSKQINILGNYIFLMSASPNDEENNSWYEIPSVLVITDGEYNIKDVIKLNGYYEEIELKDKELFAFTRKEGAESYIANIMTPKEQVSNFKDGKYTNFMDVDSEFLLPHRPTVGISQNEIIIIDEQKVLFLSDPTFKLNDHQYFVVDFTQNINTVMTDLEKEENQ